MKKIIFLVVLGFWGFGTEGWGQRNPICNSNVAFDVTTSCHQSILSPIGANWVKEKRGVTMMNYPRNSNGCTATSFLVNRASGDRDTLFMLTASHCIYTQTQADQTAFNFNYEGGGAVTGVDVLFGSKLVSYSNSLDFALLELKQTAQMVVDLDCFGPFLNGWDVSGQIPPLNFAACIHHPRSDDKKISITNNPVTSTDFYNPNPKECVRVLNRNNQTNSFWKVKWSDGHTEPGSSGSPLFDVNKRVIGIYSGFEGSLCSGILQSSHFFQKLKAAWEAPSSIGNTLKSILDPEGSNVLKIDGYYPNPNHDPTIAAINAANSYESNNSISTAEDVFPMITPPFKGFLRSYIQTTTDKDYFRLNVTGQGNLRLKLTSLPQNYNLKLVNTLGEVIAQSNNSGTTDEVINYSIIEGTRVYALIEGTGTTASTTPYKLEVDFLPCSDPFEPNEWYNQANNTAFTANLVNQPVVNRTIQASLSDADDEDWYAIGVDATGTLSLDLTDLPHDYNLQLYSIRGEVLATSNQNGLVNERVTRVHNQLFSTIYYARVYRATSNFSLCEPYTLKLNWQPSTACTAATPSVSTTAESAAGARDGSIRLALTGGVTPYAFRWSNGATTQNLSNLSGGNYSVTITTADGCISTTSARVTTTGNITPYCDATTTLTANAATFTDGSGASDYAPFSDCRWLIQPPNAERISLNFTSFTLAAGDKVSVYDGNSTSATLIDEFSASRAPSPIVSSSGSLYVRFQSDATNQAAGWTANYNVSTLTNDAALVRGYRYWFDDNDRNKITRYVTPTSSRTLNLNLSTDGLSYGLHTLHFQSFDDNGNFSSVVSQFFTKEAPKETPNDMVYWEYWFDDNYNDRTTEGYPYGESLRIDESISVPDSLKVGLHTLHAHFQDATGNWSSVISSFFYKAPPSVLDNKINAYRYWFDNNPQSMRSYAVNPPQSVFSLDSLFDASHLVVGRHLIHSQFKDLNENWSAVLTDTFNVYLQPSSRFTHQNINCTNGQVQFTNNSLNATSYLWRFGDGTTSTETAPLKTYSSVGNYTVSLIATNGGGFRDSIGQQITVTNTSVTATITPNSTVTICQKDSVQLTASGGINYRWSSGQTTPLVWIKQNGTYTVTVTNSSNCTGSASRTVNVAPLPIVDFGFSIQGGRVALTNLSSGATGYLWRFGDGTTSTLTNPVVNYTQNGLYQICLLSISSQGCRDSLCKPVNVTRVSTNDLPEGLTVKVSPNPTKGNIEVTLNFYKPFGSFDKLVVSDILGKQLITLNKIEANNSLDISNFTDGIYLVQLIFDGKTYLLEKVVKSN